MRVKVSTPAPVVSMTQAINFGPALLLLKPRVAVGHAAAGQPHPLDATAVPRLHFKTPHSRDGVDGVEHIF
jgi:hypothetical protein